jgi:hypothetical protein
LRFGGALAIYVNRWKKLAHCFGHLPPGPMIYEIISLTGVNRISISWPCSFRIRVNPKFVGLRSLFLLFAVSHLPSRTYAMQWKCILFYNSKVKLPTPRSESPILSYKLEHSMQSVQYINRTANRPDKDRQNKPYWFLFLHIRWIIIISIYIFGNSICFSWCIDM